MRINEVTIGMKVRVKLPSGEWGSMREVRTRGVIGRVISADAMTRRVSVHFKIRVPHDAYYEFNARELVKA